MAEPAIDSALTQAARGVTRELVKLFDGDVGAASQAVEELAAEPGVMNAWATRMIRREEPFAKAFSFEELPENMKATAARGMAMAYLTYTMSEERRAS